MDESEPATFLLALLLLLSTIDRIGVAVEITNVLVLWSEFNTLLDKLEACNDILSIMTEPETRLEEG